MDGQEREENIIGGKVVASAANRRTRQVWSDEAAERNQLGFEHLRCIGSIEKTVAALGDHYSIENDGNARVSAKNLLVPQTTRFISSTSQMIKLK